MTPRMTYDPDADIAYLNLSPAHTVESEEVSPGVILDYDEADRVVGIQFMQARKRLRAETLATAVEPGVVEKI